MRLFFWFVVFVWWAVDMRVFIMGKKTKYDFTEKKTKYIVIGLIFTGVTLSLLQPNVIRNTIEGDLNSIQIAGIFVVLAGVIVRLLSVFTLGRFFTPDISVVKNHRLVTTGLYRWSRHPGYAGEIISFAGLAMIFNMLPASFFIFFFPLTAFIYRAVAEEKKLLQVFGKEYEQYMKKTRRFL